MKIQAIGNKIIIKPDQEEEKKVGGIFLPETGKTRKDTGTVLSVGEGVFSVKVGDRIMFKKWEVTEIKPEGDLLFVLEDKPEDILAIIN